MGEREEVEAEAPSRVVDDQGVRGKAMYRNAFVEGMEENKRPIVAGGLGGMQPIHINIYTSDKKGGGRRRGGARKSDRTSKRSRGRRRKRGSSWSSESSSSRSSISPSASSSSNQSPSSGSSDSSSYSEESQRKRHSRRHRERLWDRKKSYHKRRSPSKRKEKRRPRNASPTSEQPALSKSKDKKRKGRQKRTQKHRSNQVADAKRDPEAARNAAVLIQRLARGFLVRLRMSRLVDKDKLLNSMVDEMIEGFIRGDFLPNMLIEVFSNRSKEYDPVTFEEQLAYEEFEKLMRKVVLEEVDTLVRACVREMMDEFLRFHASRRSNDPIESCMQNIIDQGVNTFVSECVKETLRDMVNDFLLLKNFQIYLNSVLDPLVHEVASDAMLSCQIEKTAESLLMKVTHDLTASVVQESVLEAEDSIQLQRKRSDFTQISALANKVLFRSLMTRLLQTIGSSAENVLFRQQMDLVLYKQLASALLDKIFASYGAQRILCENMGMRFAFHQVVQDAVTRPQTYLQESFFAALDQYEESIHANETRAFAADDVMVARAIPISESLNAK